VNNGNLGFGSWDMNPDLNVVPNPVVGRRYGLASLVFLVLAVLLRGPAWILAWPGISCAVVAWGYFRGGAVIYGKTNGQVSFLSALILFPTRAGQWASLVYYRRNTTLMEEIIPGLFLGRQPTRKEAMVLMQSGIRRVLDMTAEFSRPVPFQKACYLNLAVPDLTAPTSELLAQGISFIREGLDAGEPVYVHCKVGYSRSGAVVGAALVVLGRAETAEEAVRMLETRRPGIILRPEARKAIHVISDMIYKK